jgi:hypothetical protein
MDQTLTKILYIAGAGHSGSTLISSLFGMHERFFSGSEICFLLYDLAKRKDYYCSCAEKLIECPFWGDVLQKWETESPLSVDQYLLLQKRYERLRFLINPFKEKHFQSEDFQKFSKATKLLFEIIQHKSGRDWVVDASKSPARAYLLKKMGVADIKVIHLVRDGRGLSYSMLKRGKSWLRALIFWVVVNLMTDIFLKKIKMKYEDFCATPEKFMMEVGEYLNEDLTSLSDMINSGQPVNFGHTPNGNGVRAKKEITIKFDEAWKNKFSGMKRIFSTLLIFPLLWRYGYLKK